MSCANHVVRARRWHPAAAAPGRPSRCTPLFAQRVASACCWRQGKTGAAISAIGETATDPHHVAIRPIQAHAGPAWQSATSRSSSGRVPRRKPAHCGDRAAINCPRLRAEWYPRCQQLPDSATACTTAARCRAWRSWLSELHLAASRRERQGFAALRIGSTNCWSNREQALVRIDPTAAQHQPARRQR